MGDNTLEVILRLKDQLSGELKKVSGNFKNASKSLENFGTKTRDMGANITAMTAPLGIMGALSIKAAGDFEASMKRVEGVTGSTGEELAQMTDLAKELGRTTMFSASEAASGMEFLGMAGFETSEILAAMPGVLSLAAAESMELGRAADIASNILGQFQLEASETDRVVNLLSATASSSNTNVLQMSEAFKYLGPTMNDFQVSVEDTATVIGILGDAGIQGSLAGRALGTSLVKLTDPTEDMAGAMNDLGVEFFNAKGEFIGVHEMIKRLNTSLVDYTDEQRSAALASIFGKEALQEISILLNRGAVGYGELFTKISGTSKATEKAAKMMEGWNGQVKALMSAFEGLQIAIGDSGVLKDLTNMVTKFTEFTRQLSETNPVLLRVGFYIGMLLVALGPLLIIIGQVSIGISALTGVFATISTFITATAIPAIGAFIVAFWPVILVVAAVGAAIAGLYYIWSNNMFGIQEKTRAVWSFVSNFIRENWSRIAWIGGPIAGFVALIINNWSWLSSATSSTWNTITSTITGAIEGVKSGFSGLVSSVTNTLGNLWNKVQDYANKIKDAMNKISPFHKSSPSLVEYVQMGSSEIISAYENLGREIQSMDFGRDNAITGMTPQPALATARGAAQRTTNTDNRVVNINLGGVTVRSQSDIDNLVTQLSFVMKTDSSI